MMGIQTIRKATSEDYERLNAAAERFAERHNIQLYDYNLPAYAQIEYDIEARDEYNGGPRLRRLWLGVFRRAVRHSSANAIGYGYIGWRA